MKGMGKRSDNSATGRRRHVLSPGRLFQILAKANEEMKDEHRRKALETNEGEDVEAAEGVDEVVVSNDFRRFGDAENESSSSSSSTLLAEDPSWIRRGIQGQRRRHRDKKFRHIPDFDDDNIEELMASIDWGAMTED